MDTQVLNAEWAIIAGLLPEGWREAAKTRGALERGRKIKDPDTLLRLILLHVAGGLSLRQATARANIAGLSELSDVALLKRLRSAGPWLQEIALKMFDSRPCPLSPPLLDGRRIVVVDSTTVAEPGSTGTDWRIHYSILLPTLECNFFEVTGPKLGDTFRRYPVAPGDIILGDRGYCHRAGTAHVLDAGGDVVVRLSHHSYPLKMANGADFPLLPSMRELSGFDHGSWDVQFTWQGKQRPMRLCAIRKSSEAADLAKLKMRRRAKHHGHALKPETLELAEFMMVVTSLSKEVANAEQILELYRARWQVEIVFRRLKSLFGVGHVPKYDPASARAWLYAKLLAVLVIERLGWKARLFSPWGFELRESLARVH